MIEHVLGRLRPVPYRSFFREVAQGPGMPTWFWAESVLQASEPELAGISVTFAATHTCVLLVARKSGFEFAVNFSKEGGRASAAEICRALASLSACPPEGGVAIVELEGDLSVEGCLDDALYILEEAGLPDGPPAETKTTTLSVETPCPKNRTPLVLTVPRRDTFEQ